MSIEFLIYDSNGLKSSGKIVIDNPAFDIKPNDHAIYLAVKTEMTNARQGTHSTKTRSDVRGGGRKPWRQKGRGVARAGTRRSPIWVGGGRVSGPKPLNHSMKISKKVKCLARKSSLAYKYSEGLIRVIDNLNIDKPKSKVIRQLLKGFELENSRVTFLVSEITENLYMSCRNFPNILIVEAEKASTYDILDCDTLLIEKDGFVKLNNHLLLN